MASNNASLIPPYSSSLNSIHFLNYLSKPPAFQSPPPSFAEVSSYRMTETLSKALNKFMKLFGAQMTRNQPGFSSCLFSLSNWLVPTSPQTATVNGLYFQIKNHLKHEACKICFLLRNLDDWADQFYNFIKLSCEIPCFDAATFEILIKFAYMQQGEREFVAASYLNGAFWQKFQSAAKFPSKQSELDFFGDLCKFFYIFFYLNTFQNPHFQITDQTMSFLTSFPYDFSKMPATNKSIPPPPPLPTNPINPGVFQNSNPNLSPFASSQLSNPPLLQSNTLSTQTVSFLLEALKTLCNANVGTGISTIANFPSSSFPVSTPAQSTAAVNQVSPAPSDPIPPIQDTPPKDNNCLNNLGTFIPSGQTAITQAPGIFPFPFIMAGINESFATGNNFDRLNFFMNQNRNFGNSTVLPFDYPGTSGITTLASPINAPCNTNSTQTHMIPDETYDDFPSTSSPSREEENNSGTASYTTNSHEIENVIDSPEHEHDTFEYDPQSEAENQLQENIFSHETDSDSINFSHDYAAHEFDGTGEQQELDESYEIENGEEHDDSDNFELPLQNEIITPNEPKEETEETADLSLINQVEEDEFIEVDDYEPKVECCVPIEASRSCSPEALRIAPLKIKLNLSKNSKSLKRKRDHKSRKDDKDNEYKPRITGQNGNGEGNIFTDPISLRKMQRKTSDQIKKEQENFIDQLYKEPDDESKLKIIYPNVQAEICYYPGDYITKFIGDIITSRAVYNENKDNPYMIEIGRNKWIDGKDRRSFGVYILPAEFPQQANTTIKLHTTTNNIVFVGFYATQTIYPGDCLYFKR